MPADTLQARLAEQARELTAQAEIALADTDIEGVHQLRVAVRRARAVLKTSGGYEELTAELRWIFRRLGPLRDLDVLLARFRDDTDGFAPDELAAVERLLSGLVAERERVRRRVAKALRSERYTRLVAEVGAATPSGGEETLDLLVEIGKPHDRLRDEIAAIGSEPADEQLHDLRILGKKLRYVAEMATGRQAKALVKAMKRFQDVLGEFHDACVAEERLRALRPGDVAEAFVAGRLVERERVKQRETRAEWYEAWLDVDRNAQALRG
jgi:CHAD domain-containing protein